MRHIRYLAAAALLAACDGAPLPSVDSGALPPEAVAPETGSAEPETGASSTIVMEPAAVTEAPDGEAGYSAVEMVEPSRFGGPGSVRAGVLTAGDIDDRLNFTAFSRYLSRVRSETRWAMGNLANPVLAQLTGPDGQPAGRHRVTLRRAGAAEPFWDGYSGAGGMVTVFPALFGAGTSVGGVEMRVFPEGQGDPVVAQLRAGPSRAVVAVPFASQLPAFLDLMFVVDTTGSMDDELDWLTRDLNAIVRQVRSGFPELDVRYGLVVYRDQGDDYVVRSYGFTDQSGDMRKTLRAQRAYGGGDYPEAAADALAAAAVLDWRRGQGERLLFHIADAPPHDEDFGRYLAAAAEAGRRNVKVFGLGASGVAEESEYLMRQASVMTGGRYLFLTDDSGVGLAHAEPTISCYQVTDLTGLLIRVIQSELLGRRVEPSPSEVIRTVGTYQNGLCRD